MTTVGWIVAISKYSKASGILGAGLADPSPITDRFRDWLIEVKGAEPDAILYNTDNESARGRTGGTTSADVLESLKVIRTVQDCDEFFFWYSGHGFWLRDGYRSTDALVTSEFEDYETSGTACLPLREIVHLLRTQLGDGNHFYFVDACRTGLKSGSVELASTGLTARPSESGEAAVFSLYSASRGFYSADSVEFSEAVLDGMGGAGRAKVFAPDSPLDLAVFFDSLWSYVSTRLPGRELDREISGGSAGRIVEVDPALHYECRLKVEAAQSSDQFLVSAQDLRRGVMKQALLPAGASLSLPVGEHLVRVTHTGNSVTPDFHLVEVYADCAVDFSKSSRSAAGAMEKTTQLSQAKAVVNVTGTGAAAALLAKDFRGRPLDPSQQYVDPGEYTYTLVDRRSGFVLCERAVALAPGEHAAVGMRRHPVTAVQKLVRFDPSGVGRQLADALGNDLFELLPDDDNVWLSVVAAAQWVSRHWKLGPLRRNLLPDPAPLEPGRSVIQVVRSGKASLDWAIRAGNVDQTVTPLAVAAIPGVKAAAIDVAARPTYLSVLTRGAATLTYPVMPVAGAVVLFVMTPRGDDDVDVSQVIIPPDGTDGVGSGSPIEAEWGSSRASLELDWIRFKVLLQRRFLRRADVAEPLMDDDLYWSSLVSGAIADPLATVQTAYELVRRGRIAQVREMLAMQLTLLGSWPDMAAISAMTAAERPERPDAPALHLDGVLAFPDRSFPEVSTLRLDLRSPWTRWVGDDIRPAVSD